MRIRNLEKENPKEFTPIKCEMWEETFYVKTITPIYAGGVKAGYPDIEMPIRATSIRGQLRYWWRFLNCKQQIENSLNREEFFSQERAIWGGMSEDDQDYSSKVRVSIIAKKKCTLASENKNYPAYAIFPIRDSDNNLLDYKRLIKEGYKFELIVKAPREFQKSILQTIRWWASFGGIGARTRRGLGSVEVLDGSKKLLKVEEKEAEEFNCKLIIKRAENDGIASWRSAIFKLADFRQGKNIGRNEGSDRGNLRKLGRSYWPEPDSIRELTGEWIERHKPEHAAAVSFPRAAFGLPIIFEIRERGEPPKTELKPVGFDRMASPLFLKAMSTDIGKTSPVLMCLPLDHLETLDLELKYKTDREQHVIGVFERGSEGDWWPKDPQNARNKASYLNSPMQKNDGHDAISAFINYFKKG